MKQAVHEFKVWTVFFAVGLTVLISEIGVKATRPAPADTAAAEYLTDRMPTASAPVLPEELVTDLLIESVVQIESGGRPRTVGLAGERGLMQVMKDTWRETTERLYGQAVPFNRAFEPELNRQVGSAYLARLHAFLLSHRDEWKSSERALLLACYNAGPGRVQNAGFDVNHLPASTRDYVTRASALHDSMLLKYRLRLERDRQSGETRIVQLPLGVAGL